jgi:glycosyltransferase involved in cell wall biosynthesis
VKKILLIAYHFHPDLAVGAQRTIKYARYLSDHEWEPHILTVDPKYLPVQDETPVDFDYPVYRTGKLPLPDDMYRAVRRIFQPSSLEKKPTESSTSSAGQAASQGVSMAPRWKRFINSLSLTPDMHAGWLIPAVFRGLRLVRKHRYDAIYTSGPPQTCHMIGLIVSKLTGVPWVIDFRDPWSEPDRHQPIVLQFRKDFDEKYEARAVKQASLVITTSDEWRDHLKSLYTPSLDRKCHTIVNGFDEDDFAGALHKRKTPRSGPITLIHAGNMYWGRDPLNLLQAAGELIEEGELSTSEIAFEFFGHAELDTERLNSILKNYDLKQIVSFLPAVKREEYLSRLMDADVLLLLQGKATAVHIPAKAFEYLATGNQILVLTSEGATKNFMSTFDNVSIAEIDDKDEIKQAVRKILTRLRADRRPLFDNSRVAAITKRELTGKFASLLDKMLDGWQTVQDSDDVDSQLG